LNCKNVMFDVEISFFILTCGLPLEAILIVVMSLLSFYAFTHACHCKVYLLGGLSGYTEQTMVDVHIAKWRYRRNQSIEFVKKQKAHKKMGVHIRHDTNTTYEDGDKCIRIWKGREMRTHV